MKSIRTDPHNHASEGDERIRTAVTSPSAEPAYESTTTADPPKGILVRVSLDGDGVLVRDIVGLRYGWGLTLEEAALKWAQCVQDCLDETNAGGAYLAECEAYRVALAAGGGAS